MIGAWKNDDIESIVQDLIEEDRECDYCKYGSYCSGKVTNHGGWCRFPPCADLAAEEWFDLDSYLKDKEG